MTRSAPSAAQPRSAWLNYLSLFGSVGTLLCCALPSLLVLFGFGATVAVVLSSLPWLVALSKHKAITFALSGLLIALGFVNTYYVAPRLRPDPTCTTEACCTASRFSRVLLWTSASIYTLGFFVVYILGPILARLDAAQ
jgi:mercuric ion transport protein